MSKETKLKTLTNETLNTQEIEKSLQKNENDVCFTELDPSLGFKILYITNIIIIQKTMAINYYINWNFL